jgi:hypothetical protein
MILRTVEQRKATDACEKYLCTKDQCSPLRNRGLHMHTTSLAYRAAYITSIFLTLMDSGCTHCSLKNSTTLQVCYSLLGCKLDTKLNSDSKFKINSGVYLWVLCRYLYLLSGWGDQDSPHLCIVASHWTTYFFVTYHLQDDRIHPLNMLQPVLSVTMSGNNTVWHLLVQCSSKWLV